MRPKDRNRLFLQAAEKVDAYSDEVQETRKYIVRMLDRPSIAGVFDLIVI
jgi:hypothetical protein